MAHLSRLFIYPIKSTAPVEVQEARVEERGLAHDRRYVITDAQGRFLSARRFPRMVLIHTTLNGAGLRVRAPGQTTLELDPAGFPDRYETISVWKDQLQGQRCGDAADAWFSAYLGAEARICFMGRRSRRPARGGGEVSFADSAPLLLLSEASVEDLNARLESPVGVRNFRPNLVIADSRPYEEDGWKNFSVGDARFRGLWRCSRCILTTVDPDTGIKHPGRQPLQALSGYRRGADGHAYLGLNVGVLTTGTIAVGQALRLDASEGEAHS